MSHHSGDSFLRQRFCECCGNTLTLTEQVHIGHRCESCDDEIKGAAELLPRPAELVATYMAHVVTGVAGSLVFALLFAWTAWLTHTYPVQLPF